MNVRTKYTWDNECSVCPGGTDCTKCYKTALHSKETRLGILTANCVRRAIRDGVRHYDIVTKKELITVRQVLDSIMENGEVILVDSPKGGFAK